MTTHHLKPGLSAADTTAWPRLSLNAATGIGFRSLAFDDTVNQFAYWDFVAESYGGGDLTLDIYWFADTATSGNVDWSARVMAVTPETDTVNCRTASFAAVTQVTDSPLGATAGRLMKATITISTNKDSLASGDILTLMLYRDAVGETSGMVGDAHFRYGVLSYAA